MGGGTDIAGVKLGAQIMMDAASGGWVGGVLDVGVVCGVVSVVCCVEVCLTLVWCVVWCRWCVVWCAVDLNSGTSTRTQSHGRGTECRTAGSV